MFVGICQSFLGLQHFCQAPRQPAAAAPATQHLLRAKARPRPRRAPHAVAPQATASPAKAPGGTLHGSVGP